MTPIRTGSGNRCGHAAKLGWATTGCTTPAGQWTAIVVGRRTARPTRADELAKLADLRDRGTISDEEFQHAKAKLLGKQPEPVSPAYTGGRPAPSTR